MLAKQLLIVGIGLIGGSFALSLRKAGVVGRILGNSRSQKTCALALENNVVDEASTDLLAMLDKLSNGDVVFLAVPTLTVEKLLPSLEAALDRGVIVTDGSSVKGSVHKAVVDCFGSFPANFVLGHPIAGSEKSGVNAAKVDLYQNRRVILTPVPENAPDATERVSSLWQSCGAIVDHMSVADHDRVLAATSHLPHILAYALVDCLASDNESQDVFRFAAGGFRDFTRIAGSDTQMWHDIVIANKDAVLQRMDEFSENLARLRQAIDQEDGEAILSSFDRARAAREHFVKLFSELSEKP